MISRNKLGNAVVAVALFAVVVLGDPIDTRIQAGIRLVYQQQYHKADSLFACLPADHPSRDFFRLVLCQVRMEEDFDFRFPDTIRQLCSATVAKAENMIKTDSAKAEGYFYKGFALGAKGTYETKVKSYVSAFFHSVQGISALARCLRCDSTWYDAYAGLGMFHYWKGKMTRFLHWLPLLKDERNQGKSELALAVNKAKYLRHAARYSLVWAHYTEKEYKESLDLTQAFLAEFPGNTIFLRTKSDILLKMRKYKAAAAAYCLLLDTLEQRPPSTGIPQMAAWYKLGIALQLAGQPRCAREAYEKARATPFRPWVKEEAVRLQDNAKRKLNQLTPRQP